MVRRLNSTPVGVQCIVLIPFHIFTEEQVNNIGRIHMAMIYLDLANVNQLQLIGGLDFWES